MLSIVPRFVNIFFFFLRGGEGVLNRIKVFCRNESDLLAWRSEGSERCVEGPGVLLLALTGKEAYAPRTT